MKIVIFGATGRTGRQLVQQGLAQGHEVTAFVRNASKMPLDDHQLRLVQGDARQPAQVEEAVAEAEAVLLALGHTADSQKDVLTVATENVLAAMVKHQVPRLINLTGAGVADPKDEPKLLNKVITILLKTFQGELLADSERQAELIRQSDREWVIVRAPRLIDGERKGTIRVGYVGKGTGSTITRADVADFVLKQLSDDTYLRKAPMISN